MQDLRKTMIGYTRYSTYLMISIWKIGLFIGSASAVSIYYGLVREPRYDTVKLIKGKRGQCQSRFIFYQFLIDIRIKNF